jgi:hypothetical protein
MSAIQIGEIYKYFIVLTKQYLKENQWKSYDKLKPAKYKGFLNARLEDKSVDMDKSW